MNLAARHCEPCEGGTPLPPEEAERLAADLPSWSLLEDQLQRDVDCKDFQHAVDLIVRLGAVAEEEGHHPDLFLHGYKHLRITLTTHAVGGLSENDFILAAKFDELL